MLTNDQQRQCCSTLLPDGILIDLLWQPRRRLATMQTKSLAACHIFTSIHEVAVVPLDLACQKLAKQRRGSRWVAGLLRMVILLPTPASPAPTSGPSSAAASLAVTPASPPTPAPSSSAPEFLSIMITRPVVACCFWCSDGVGLLPRQVRTDPADLAFVIIACCHCRRTIRLVVVIVASCMGSSAGILQAIHTMIRAPHFCAELKRKQGGRMNGGGYLAESRYSYPVDEKAGPI
eukprot:scaffold23495_cov31-Prasinocladus_malaysianus.AAC.1